MIEILGLVIASFGVASGVGVVGQGDSGLPSANVSEYVHFESRLTLEPLLFNSDGNSYTFVPTLAIKGELYYYQPTSWPAGQPQPEPSWSWGSFDYFTLMFDVYSDSSPNAVWNIFSINMLTQRLQSANHLDDLHLHYRLHPNSSNNFVLQSAYVFNDSNPSNYNFGVSTGIYAGQPLSGVDHVSYVFDTYQVDHLMYSTAQDTSDYWQPLLDEAEEEASTAYTNGYSDGYLEGLNTDNTVTSIFGGIMEIGLLPVNFFLGIFNFNILGVNLTSFVTSLITVLVVVKVISLISGNGGKDS